MDINSLRGSLQDRNIALHNLVYSRPTVSVYRGMQQSRPVAVKVLPLATFSREKLEREFQVMLRLNHNNIVKLYDYFNITTEREFLVIVSEWGWKDLASDITQRKTNNFPWTEIELWTITQAIVDALCYMQEQHYAHRDIKPENIFLAPSLQPKIGDFGSAVMSEESSLMATVTGTPLYLSPVLRQAFGSRSAQVFHNIYKSDVYSLGLTLLALARLDPPISLLGSSSAAENISLILNSLVYSDNFKSLFATMLHAEESQRPDFIQLATWMGLRLPTPELQAAAEEKTLAEQAQDGEETGQDSGEALQELRQAEDAPLGAVDGPATLEPTAYLEPLALVDICVEVDPPAEMGSLQPVALYPSEGEHPAGPSIGTEGHSALTQEFAVLLEGAKQPPVAGPGNTTEIPAYPDLEDDLQVCLKSTPYPYYGYLSEVPERIPQLQRCAEADSLQQLQWTEEREHPPEYYEDGDGKGELMLTEANLQTGRPLVRDLHSRSLILHSRSLIEDQYVLGSSAAIHLRRHSQELSKLQPISDANFPEVKSLRDAGFRQNSRSSSPCLVEVRSIQVNLPKKHAVISAAPLPGQATSAQTEEAKYRLFSVERPHESNLHGKDQEYVIHDPVSKKRLRENFGDVSHRSIKESSYVAEDVTSEILKDIYHSGSVSMKQARLSRRRIALFLTMCCNWIRRTEH